MFTAPSDNVPLPDFVNVEIGVAIGSDTVTFPAPENVTGIAMAPPMALPEETSNVRSPPSLAISSA